MALTIIKQASTGWPPSAAADTCVDSAFSYFINNIVSSACTATITIKVAWASGPAGTAAFNTPSYTTDTNYAGVKTLLTNAQATNPNQILQTFLTTLPAGDPSPFATYKAMGAWNAILTNGTWNGSPPFIQPPEIALNSDLGLGGFDFSTNIDGPFTARPAKSLFLHELREACGGFGEIANSRTSAMDLASYSGGVRNFSASTARQFSYDGVNMNGTYFVSSAGDVCDFNAVEIYGGTSGSTPLPFNQRAILTLGVIGIPLTAFALSIAGFGVTGTVGGIAGFRARR